LGGATTQEERPVLTHKPEKHHSNIEPRSTSNKGGVHTVWEIFGENKTKS